MNLKDLIILKVTAHDKSVRRRQRRRRASMHRPGSLTARRMAAALRYAAAGQGGS